MDWASEVPGATAGVAWAGPAGGVAATGGCANASAVPTPTSAKRTNDNPLGSERTKNLLSGLACVGGVDMKAFQDGVYGVEATLIATSSGPLLHLRFRGRASPIPCVVGEQQTRYPSLARGNRLAREEVGGRLGIQGLAFARTHSSRRSHARTTSAGLACTGCM
jgi:hypothetical protein